MPVYSESYKNLSREDKNKVYEIEGETDSKLRPLKMITSSPLWNASSRVVMFEVRHWGESDNTVCSCQFPLDRVLADPCAIVEEVYFNALFSDHGRTRL
jgi:hypothetical protein